MENFQLLAQPWWVNLLLFVPLVAYARWRHQGLQLHWRQLVILAIFAVAFGFVEAAVVVYLRAAVGLLPGYMGTLSDVQRLSASFYQQSKSINDFPSSLLTVEVFREGATILMLFCIALLTAPRLRERCASFLWAFALWDISYYAGLWATVRWPSSFRDLDVLFLIPVPWVAQVWFPILVGALTLLAIALTKAKSNPEHPS